MTESVVGTQHNVVTMVSSGTNPVTVANMRAYDVLSFGATGGGVVGDEVAIQAAVDAAEVSGGVVYFPTGTYNIDVLIEIGASNVTLFLDAGCTIKATTGLSGSCILINGDLTNVRIIGNGGIIDANAQTTTSGILVTGAGTGLTIKDIEIKNATASGKKSIQVLGTAVDNRYNNVTFQNLYVHDCEEGIVMQWCDNIIMDKCYVYDMEEQDCFEFADCQFGAITNCIAKNAGEGDSCYNVYGNTSGCADIVMTNCIAIQNAARTVGPFGFNLEAANDSIANNRIFMKNCTVSGVVPADAATPTASTSSFHRGVWINRSVDVTWDGGSVRGCCFDGNAQSIYLAGATAKDVSIINTTIDKAWDNAFASVGAKGSLVLDNVHIKDYGYSSTFVYALVISGSMPDSVSITNIKFSRDTGLSSVNDTISYIQLAGTADGAPEGFYIANCRTSGGLGTNSPKEPITMTASQANLRCGDNFFREDGETTQNFYGPRSFEVTLASGTNDSFDHECGEGYTPASGEIFATPTNAAAVAGGEFYVHSITGTTGGTSGVFQITTAASVTNGTWAIHITGKGSSLT